MSRSFRLLCIYRIIGTKMDANHHNSASAKTTICIAYPRGTLAHPHQNQHINRRQYDSRNSTSRRTAQGIIGRPGNTHIFEQNLSHKPEQASGAPKYSENLELWRIWMNFHQFQSLSGNHQVCVKMPIPPTNTPIFSL